MFGVPPQMVPIVLVLLILLFFGLVWFFRKSTGAQKILEETLGDDTPQAALKDHRLSRERLLRHRGTPGLDPQLARQIDDALYQKS